MLVLILISLFIIPSIPRTSLLPQVLHPKSYQRTFPHLQNLNCYSSNSQRIMKSEVATLAQHLHYLCLCFPQPSHYKEFIVDNYQNTNNWRFVSTAQTIYWISSIFLIAALLSSLRQNHALSNVFLMFQQTIVL